MLESIRKHTHGWLAKLILLLLAIPFLLWGVDSYVSDRGTTTVVAKVGDERISLQEFNQAVRMQQARLRSNMGSKFDPTMFDTKEVRLSILQNLINDKLLVIAAKKQHLSVSDSQLAKIISEVPAFQENGKFSGERYLAALRQQEINSDRFEALLKQDILMQQLQDSFAKTAVASQATVAQLIKLGDQQREISKVSFTPEQFLPQVKVDPTTVKSYYEQKAQEFRTPEQARVEYVVLSTDALTPQISPTEEEIRGYYEQHAAAQYTEPEERQASHILLSVTRDAPKEQLQAAQQKAEQLLAQLKTEPQKFAELAKQHSQDPGSAQQGGDLGFFTRGSMVKPFEDAVFQMKLNEIKGPVQSDFGIHIIQLTAIKPSKRKELEQVRPEIVQEIKKQKATQKFNEIAEAFGNVVYEQSNSLQPAAQLAGTVVQTSPWITRQGQDPILNHPKLMDAIFSADAIKEKRNSEAIEVAPSKLVAARVIEYKPASQRPFNEVSQQIEARLQREQAFVLAANQGKGLLAKLKQGQDLQLNWTPPQLITRQLAPELDEPSVRELFKADVKNLPAYTGIENPQSGYTLFKITKVIDGIVDSEAKKKAYTERLSQILGQESFNAYLNSLKSQIKVKINHENLEKIER